MNRYKQATYSRRHRSSSMPPSPAPTQPPSSFTTSHQNTRNTNPREALNSQIDDGRHQQTRARPLALMEQMAKPTNNPSPSTSYRPTQKTTWLNTPTIEIINVPSDGEEEKANTKEEEEEKEEEERINKLLEEMYHQE